MLQKHQGSVWVNYVHITQMPLVGVSPFFWFFIALENCYENCPPICHMFYLNSWGLTRNGQCHYTIKNGPMTNSNFLQLVHLCTGGNSLKSLLFNPYPSLNIEKDYFFFHHYRVKPPCLFLMIFGRTRLPKNH